MFSEQLQGQGYNAFTLKNKNKGLKHAISSPYLLKKEPAPFVFAENNGNKRKQFANLPTGRRHMRITSQGYFNQKQAQWMYHQYKYSKNKKNIENNLHEQIETQKQKSDHINLDAFKDSPNHMRLKSIISRYKGQNTHDTQRLPSSYLKKKDIFDQKTNHSQFHYKIQYQQLLAENNMIKCQNKIWQGKYQSLKKKHNLQLEFMQDRILNLEIALQKLEKSFNLHNI